MKSFPFHKKTPFRKLYIILDWILSSFLPLPLPLPLPLLLLIPLPLHIISLPSLMASKPLLPGTYPEMSPHNKSLTSSLSTAPFVTFTFPKIWINLLLISELSRDSHSSNSLNTHMPHMLSNLNSTRLTSLHTNCILNSQNKTDKQHHTLLYSTIHIYTTNTLQKHCKNTTKTKTKTKTTTKIKNGFKHIFNFFIKFDTLLLFIHTLLYTIHIMYVIFKYDTLNNSEEIHDIVESYDSLLTYIQILLQNNPTLILIQPIPHNPHLRYSIPILTDSHTKYYIERHQFATSPYQY